MRERRALRLVAGIATAGAAACVSMLAASSALGRQPTLTFAQAKRAVVEEGRIIYPHARVQAFGCQRDGRLQIECWLWAQACALGIVGCDRRAGSAEPYQHVRRLSRHRARVWDPFFDRAYTVPV